MILFTFHYNIYIYTLARECVEKVEMALNRFSLLSFECLLACSSAQCPVIIHRNVINRYMYTIVIHMCHATQLDLAGAPQWKRVTYSNA